MVPVSWAHRYHVTETATVTATAQACKFLFHYGQIDREVEPRLWFLD